MDDKEFLDEMTQDGAAPQTEQNGPVADPALTPGYTDDENAAENDLSEEPDMELDAIMAEFREQAANEEEAADSEPLPAEEASLPESEPLPAEEALPESEPQPPTKAVQPAFEFQLPEDFVLPEGEDDEVKAMLIAMRELTEEVKQLREQLQTSTHTVAAGGGEKSLEKTEAAAAADKQPDGNTPKELPKKNKVLSIISSVLFYTVVVAMVLGAFLMRSTSKGQPFMIAGFSAANVLTSSMEDVYPRGSLIITRQVDAKELQIGDDITFMVSEDSSITHRIIGITENYQGTGERAFQTQGTKNPDPDKEMVAAANVVGKVIFHSKALGDFANFVKENWPILIFVLIVIIALISFLKWNAKKSDEDDETPKKQKKLSERRSESNGDK